MTNKQTKIGIETTYEDSDEVDVEFMWADAVGDNHYQLKNFPFYAYGISFDDVVEAHPKDDEDPYPYLTKVIKKSGHRTLRIILDESAKESERSQQLLQAIASMGCGYEGMNGKTYFVVNVQPHCDFDAVRDFLNDEDIRWEYADPTFDEMQAVD
ncbi:MAG: DUF4265 domain-containing protein [Woeseiaceae bacterium]